MSSILNRIKKKNYKQLYETELNNRKLYEARYKSLTEEYVELQKSSGIADLRKENASLKIELEDTKGFLAQETEAKEELLKQRAKLKKQLKLLREELKENGTTK